MNLPRDVGGARYLADVEMTCRYQADEMIRANARCDSFNWI